MTCSATRHTASVLVANGCDLMQGPLFGNALREGRKQSFPAQAGIASDRNADPVIFRHPHTASGPYRKSPSDQLNHLKSQTGIFTQGYAAQVRSAD